MDANRYRPVQVFPFDSENTGIRERPTNVIKESGNTNGWTCHNGTEHFSFDSCLRHPGPFLQSSNQIECLNYKLQSLTPFSLYPFQPSFAICSLKGVIIGISDFEMRLFRTDRFRPLFCFPTGILDFRYSLTPRRFMIDDLSS